MKKKIIIGVSLFLAFVLFVVIIENRNKVTGTEGILKRACKEIAADGVDKSDYSIVGSSTRINEYTGENEILVWIMTENTVGIKNYYPLSFKVLDDDHYEFIHYHRIFYEIREDVRGYYWDPEYSFMINTSEYEYLNLYDRDRNLTQIKIDSIPFVYCTDMDLYNYTVVDYEGNEYQRK